MSPTDPKEIELIIKSLSSNRSTGQASIPTSILKMFKKDLKTPLSNLVNLSFEYGAFPEILKIPSITPIYRKDDPLSWYNYRQIYVLSNVSKIMEKRLFFFPENNSYLYEFKFGFRNKTSTNNALIYITEKIREALDQGLLASGVNIDLQKHLTQRIIQSYLRNSTTTVIQKSQITG